MTKKKPIKNEDTTLNFRIPKELKAKIEKKAEEKNLTTSSYVRDLLESVYNGEYCQSEEYKSKIKSFLFSKEFLRLIIWINSKRIYDKKTEDIFELESYIRTLKQIEGHLPDNLVKEFDKVLNDILYVRSETGFYGERFNFLNSPNDTKKFNLKLVEEFFLNKNIFETFIGEYSEYTIEVINKNDFEM